jgi:hypothetical protein
MTSLMLEFNNKRPMTLLIGGCFLAVCLGGCKFVEVQVQVDTCPTSMGSRVVSGGGPPNEEGGCQTMLLTAAADAYGALNTANNNQPITDHNHLCNANTWKCKSSPGSCYMGGLWKPCKTYFTPTSGNNGNCACNCPPS